MVLERLAWIDDLEIEGRIAWTNCRPRVPCYYKAGQGDPYDVNKLKGVFMDTGIDLGEAWTRNGNMWPGPLPAYDQSVYMLSFLGEGTLYALNLVGLEYLETASPGDLPAPMINRVGLGPGKFSRTGNALLLEVRERTVAFGRSRDDKLLIAHYGTLRYYERIEYEFGPHRPDDPEVCRTWQRERKKDPLASSGTQFMCDGDQFRDHDTNLVVWEEPFFFGIYRAKSAPPSGGDDGECKVCMP